MTDFTGARNLKCRSCGTWFCDVEGPNCDCGTPRVSFEYDGESYQITEDGLGEIIDQCKAFIAGHECWDGVQDTVMAVLKEAGYTEKPRKEDNKGHYQWGKDFLAKWREASKEIPRDKRDSALNVLVGAMARYIPPEETKGIISCVMADVK